MCHDISFSADTVEFITDLLPDVEFTGQKKIDFTTTEHLLSMSHRNCLTLYKEDKVIKCSEFEWGLIPFYMNTPEAIKKGRIKMANARAENIFVPKSPWYRLRERRRCLIAVQGIFEHRAINGWKNKVPYYVQLACSSHMLLPALYSYSPIPDIETGEVKGTFAIITRDANDIMKKVHNHGENKHRMPLFMQPIEALKWIQEDMNDEQMKAFLSFEIPSDELLVQPVFTIRTTKARPDGLSKIATYDWPNLPPLGNDDPLPEKDLFSMS